MLVVWAAVSSPQYPVVTADENIYSGERKVDLSNMFRGSVI